MLDAEDLHLSVDVFQPFCDSGFGLIQVLFH